ncbi:hypothetical protein N7533_005418 [Penicillium manginii]|uniref:uncharacterized protein n=1 Tax=Penicillium manginii TaxID=203109 RepID=UPI0025485EC4|nr:uncharacterized protein N7533_005418 [Penicillium manginii]KAJ5755875.1 hypothetical protein N7533_005418 [Penicillium manginii]
MSGPGDFYYLCGTIVGFEYPLPRSWQIDKRLSEVYAKLTQHQVDGRCASAITTFVTLALEGTLVLYQTIQSLQSREKVIRELRQELEALQGVLQTLWGSTDNLDVDLASLEQPLTRCKNACGDFNAHFTGRQARLGAPSSTRASCDLSSPVLILLNAENPPPSGWEYRNQVQFMSIKKMLEK